MVQHQAEAVAHGDRPNEQHADSALVGMFRCPRCGTEYPRRLLALRWSEWGQICWCPERGRFRACDVFSEARPAARKEVPCRL